MHVGIREMPVIKGKEMKSSFQLRTLIVTLRASRSANEETPLTMEVMQETEGVLPPVASVALFSLPSGALLLWLLNLRIENYVRGFFVLMAPGPHKEFSLWISILFLKGVR